MLDFPNKVVTLILVFLMLVVAPLIWMFSRDDMVSQRLALNEMTQFLDKTTDKGYIEAQDIDDLYLGLNATGGTYDVKVRRYMPTPIPAGSGQSRLLYKNVDYYDKVNKKAIKLNKGDIVKLTVEEVGYSSARRLLWTVLRFDSGKQKTTLSASVR